MEALPFLRILPGGKIARSDVVEKIRRQRHRPHAQHTLATQADWRRGGWPVGKGIPHLHNSRNHRDNCEIA